ncbi:hypothetical protein PFISCL1PPCAC_4943, partial [Pristionchus fissidentatus]
LPKKERLRLASTCKHLNELEKKSGGRNIDVVRLFRRPMFLMKIGKNKFYTDTNGRLPFLDFTTFFKNAHISCFDTNNSISSWSSKGDCPTLPIFESSTFSALVVGTFANHTHDNRFIVSLANSRAFTRRSLGVRYHTSNEDPLDDEEFLLSLPRTRNFRLHLIGFFSDGHVCPSMESLQRLVDLSEDIQVHIQATQVPEQMLNDIFKIVLNSPGRKRVEMSGFPIPD